MGEVTPAHAPYNADPFLMRVLLTRPRAQSVAFDAQIKARFGGDADVVISPVMEIVALPVDVDFDAFDALVFTSQNGVSAYEALNGPQGKIAYCVGGRTAAAAREAGFDAASANGDIVALNALLNSLGADKSLLHLCGKHVAGEAVRNVTRVEAYDQRPISLSQQAKDMLMQPTEIIVPLFSPNAARWFTQEVEVKILAGLHAVCISKAVADELDQSRFSSVLQSGEPIAQGMLDKMSDFFPARPA